MESNEKRGEKKKKSTSPVKAAGLCHGYIDNRYLCHGNAGFDDSIPGQCTAFGTKSTDQPDCKEIIFSEWKR